MRCAGRRKRCAGPPETVPAVPRGFCRAGCPGYGSEIVGTVIWRRLAVIAVAASAGVSIAAGTGSAAVKGVASATAIVVPFGSAGQKPGQPVTVSSPAPQAAATSGVPRQLIVPDVFAVIPTGMPGADIAKIRKLSGVRSVLTVSGGAIKIAGKPANVLGVALQQFRSWTPPSAAGDEAAWKALARGKFVTTTAAKHRLRLTSGGSYPVIAARRLPLPFGGSAELGISGVDAVVGDAVAARLGLVKNLGVLINAPADNLTSLVSQVRAVTGTRGRVVSLQPTVTVKVGKLPVTTAVPSGRPATYLTLYQESAARYCPGLSWTVLAAIGAVESGNGANVGPSSAGALGPMQFLPSTWATWGIDGFGDTGAPNVMNPFDAVPSAAVYLCAAGAAQGGSALYNAIYAYNHADWYVNEVLAIAKEYAQSGA
jgi:Transglycosylase SLT domain